MHKSTRLFLTIALLGLLPIVLFGQRALTGTVTDAENNEPLIGANVAVTGKTIGTITDLDGNFRLEVPDGTQSLTISYIGYTNQEISLDASNVVNISLKSGTYLDEVVVIGYGEVKKEDATGAVQTVSEESFNKGAITSAQELLTGKISGVQITNSNDAGGGAQIRIRGGSSLSASNDPLIVIDGVPIDNGGVSGGRNNLNLINPNDIESMTVLKDASATAIYGSRASNGVIIITTKKGKLGKKLSVEYNGNFSISNRSSEVDVLNADEFRNLVVSRYDEDSNERALLGDANTDWQDEIFQQGFGHDHNLNFSGGIAKVLPYRLSLGYTDKKGILKTDEFDRITASLNLSPGFLDNRLQVNANFKTSITNNRFADQGAIGAAIAFDPTKPVLDPESPYAEYWTWTDVNGNPNVLAPANPLALLELKEDFSTINRYIINGSADYRFLPSWRINVSAGYDYSKGEGTVFIPQNASFSFDPVTGGGTDNTYSQEKENKLFESYLSYDTKLGKHKFDILGGYSYQNFFSDKSFRNSDVDGTPENILEDLSDPSEIVLISFFGRANLNLFDKVLLTGTLRRDGSSRFIEENRWGLFPAAAIAWKAFSNPEAKGLSQLKLRVGWGITGQQDVGGAYDRLPVYRASTNGAQYLFGGVPIDTWRPEPYTLLKWEETTTTNLGVDYGFFKDRIYGSLEIYQRNTEDLLNFAPIAAGAALTNEDDQNIGSLKNRGVEFSVNVVPIQSTKTYWDLGFNLSVNRNEITKLILSDDPNYEGVATGSTGFNNIQIHSVGFPTSSFYVYEQTYDDAGNPVEGDYVDRNDDGEETAADFYRLEKPAPNAFFGLTSNAEYGNWSLSFAGRAQVGNYIYNGILAGGANYSQLSNVGILKNVPEETESINFENQELFSDYFVQDASFLRLDHITLGYNFANLVKQISNLRLYATLQNPFVMTSYSGVDPEISSGIDNSIYPRSRTFLLGVNAKF